jgi:outer membrane biogenesis lipoprotein LolB
MARTDKAERRRIGSAALALALLAGCGQAHKPDSAEREFNAWANHVEQSNGATDFEEPANVMDRVVPPNGQ